MNARRKFLILGCLYFSQGLPFGFFVQALPIIMRDMGASLPQIGAAYLLALPWALKWLWAPLVDRPGADGRGRKKTWIISLQLIGVVMFLVMGLLPRYEGYLYLMIGFLLANLVAATQDIASDGLAVMLLNRSERGFGNGLQVAGYRLGMIFGGGFILMSFAYLGWRGAFLVIAITLALATLPLLSLREPDPEHGHDSAAYKAILASFFKRKGIAWWLFVICFFKFGDAMASEMLKPYLRDAGLSVETLGYYLGTIGVGAGLAGAVFGGWLIQKLGRYRGVILFGCFQALTVATYFALASGWVPDTLLPYLIALEYFSGGTSTVSIFTVMMDACRAETAATDYTVQASLVVVSTGSAAFLAGNVAEHFGYAANFAVSGLLCLTGVMLFAITYGRFVVEGGLRPVDEASGVET